jgi:hypothetical protein
MRRIEGPGKRRIVLGVGGGGPLFSVDGADDEDIVYSLQYLEGVDLYKGSDVN